MFFFSVQNVCNDEGESVNVNVIIFVLFSGKSLSLFTLTFVCPQFEFF